MIASRGRGRRVNGSDPRRLPGELSDAIHSEVPEPRVAIPSWWKYGFNSEYLLESAVGVLGLLVLASKNAGSPEDESSQRKGTGW